MIHQQWKDFDPLRCFRASRAAVSRIADEVALTSIDDQSLTGRVLL